MSEFLATTLLDFISHVLVFRQTESERYFMYITISQPVHTYTRSNQTPCQQWTTIKSDASNPITKSPIFRINHSYSIRPPVCGSPIITMKSNPIQSNPIQCNLPSGITINQTIPMTAIQSPPPDHHESNRFNALPVLHTPITLSPFYTLCFETSNFIKLMLKVINLISLHRW